MVHGTLVDVVDVNNVFLKVIIIEQKNEKSKNCPLHSIEADYFVIHFFMFFNSMFGFY